MNEDFKAHLEFFEELGIDGVRLEPEWRTRTENAAMNTNSVPSGADP